jgi:hypothetical protein
MCPDFEVCNLSQEVSLRRRSGLNKRVDFTKGLFPFPLPPAYPKKRSANQTGLNRPVFLPSKPFIPDYKPNPLKSGKTSPKTPHSGRSEKTKPKQNKPILSPNSHSGQYLDHG